MSVKFINLVTDFLKNRKQRIELNEKASSWVDVTAGVPQGFIVGPVYQYPVYRWSVHPPLIFINSNMSEASSQKRLGVIFVEFLKFLEHFKIILSKINKSIGLLRKLQSLLPRNALITIYKSFIRPHLDYNDVIYDQTFNYYFHQKFESIQYNACLAITGAIRSTSRDKS